MKKNLKKLLVGVMISSMLVPTNVWAQSQDTGSTVSEDNGEGISPRISVSKYVEVQVEYMLLESVPKYHYYSYYDYDYNTTLKGTLVLQRTLDTGEGVVAYYAGHCSGSI